MSGDWKRRVGCGVTAEWAVGAVGGVAGGDVGAVCNGTRDMGGGTKRRCEVTKAGKGTCAFAYACDTRHHIAH